MTFFQEANLRLLELEHQMYCLVFIVIMLSFLPHVNAESGIDYCEEMFRNVLNEWNILKGLING